jgi:hypothetical protein
MLAVAPSAQIPPVILARIDRMKTDHETFAAVDLARLGVDGVVRPFRIARKTLAGSAFDV